MDKGSFRKCCLAKLKQAALQGKRNRDARLRKRLDFLLESLAPGRVLFYLPLPMEADILPLMKRWRGKVWSGVPLMEGDSFRMVKYRLPVKLNSFKIYEPGRSGFFIKEPEVIVVPCVGVDAAMGRIGFGKGMYDRFCAGLKSAPILIFVQPEECISNQFFSQPHDILGDFLVTPRRTYYNRKRGMRHGIGNGGNLRAHRGGSLVCYPKTGQGQIRNFR